MHRWFTLAVFAGAALLFTVEPLTGRLVLPLAGGTPAVWTTCLLFFQAALLAGYAYAHFIGERLPMRAQIPVHLIVLATAAIALPIFVDRSWFAGTGHPVLTLLPLLAKTVGLPFFALATTAPLMQRWFATVAPTRDPYPLYAASNAGSLLALAAYPFFIEPTLGLVDQGRWWAVGYGVYGLLIVICAMMTLRVAEPKTITKVLTSRNDPWARWILLSFAPSSLLMGVTTAITTDITPVPLLWIVPLALYLLTFIIAFSARPAVPHWLALRVAPIAALALYFALLTGSTSPWWAILGVHLFGFFAVALACHGELSKLRPPVQGLTRYYLLISVGGVLGGLLNAIIAPVVLQKVGLAEYPLVLALAVGLLPNRPRAKAMAGIPELTGISALTFPVIVGGVAATLILVARFFGPAIARYLGSTISLIGGIAFGMPLIMAYFLVDRPRRFATSLGLVWLAGQFHVGQAGQLLFFERNFFGTVRACAENPDGAHILIHGSTIHGRQLWKDGRGVNEPLAYYGRTGPIGDVFRVIEKRGTPNIAACGLGAGSIAAYARPGQAWTFYEIDPAMVHVAQTPELFTFLTDNFPGGRGLRYALGDARLEIAHATDGEFGLIVLDAFSSDSIPVHLLTREAMQMYLDKLSANGLIAVHISNRYLDLKPVLASAARDLNLTARFRFDDVPASVANQKGTISSIWVVLGRTESDLGNLATDVRWERLPALSPSFRTWTDDYSNLLNVFMLDRE